MRTRLSLLACSSVAVSLGCGANPTASSEPTTRVLATAAPAAVSATSRSVVVAFEPLGELDVDPESFDFAAHPDIAARVAESPHAYFRFTQRLFSRAACKRFQSSLATAPTARLHGDPHVEQYHVSDLGRGLTDFDDAAVGPTLLDLTRFASSSILAARLHDLDAEGSKRLLDELFRGYRAGIAGAELAKEPPRFATALASKFKSDPKGFRLYLENNLETVDAREDGFVRAELETYAASERKREPNRPASFFQIKKLGRTKLGIGSALTRKYLVVLEGGSVSEDDDVVVELKEVADLSSVPCVKAIPSGAADAREDMQNASGNKKFLAPALLPGGRFWVNQWLTNYEEARIKKLAVADLEALVYEAGIALARVHRMPLPDGKAPSPQALALDASMESEVRKVAATLANETVLGWQRFRRDVKEARVSSR